MAANFIGPTSYQQCFARRDYYVPVLYRILYPEEMPQPRSAFLSYEKACDWARSKGLNSGVAFRRLGSNRPDDVPSNPNTFYRDRWVNWGEFLGNDRVANQSRHFCSYSEAQAWAISLGIRNREDWRAMDASSFPKYIPKNPPLVFKIQWRGWTAFLRLRGERRPRKSVRTFASAAEWARTNGIRTSTEWRKHKSIPSDIPRAPDRRYPEEWRGWGAFLGTDRIAHMERFFRPYREASAWACAAGVQSRTEWSALGREKIPLNIPLNPARSYPDEWKGWGSFLGTGRVAPQDRSFLSYAETQAWARQEGITSREEWQATRLPPNVPANPDRAYKEWIGWAEFLGKRLGGGASVAEYILHHELSLLLPVSHRGRALWVGSTRKKIDIAMPSLKLALEYDGAYWHSQSVEKDRQETRNFAQAGWRLVRLRVKPLPVIHPSDDLRVDQTIDYRQLVLQVLTHLLDIKAIPSDRISAAHAFVRAGKLSISADKISALLGRRTFKQAREWARAEGIRTKTEWFNGSNTLPFDLPADPRAFYRLEWTTWGDFLGTGRCKNGEQVFRSYEEASAWARSAGITTGKQWREHPERTHDLPFNPDALYKREWRGWGTFLGTGRVADQDRTFRPYSQASAWARAHGLRSSTTWHRLKRSQIPEDIPVNPDLCAAYRGEWQGWAVFLQNGRRRRTQRSNPDGSTVPANPQTRIQAD